MVSKSFSLSKIEIKVEIEKETLFDSRAGAISTFEGRVRDHNEGMMVCSLTYEAYDSLAYKIADTIIREAKSKFEIIDTRIVHRTGLLEIGDLAVWVGVAAAHRKEAFQACQYVIDEIKHRLPIWKKELYTDGSYKWVNCQSCSPQANNEIKDNQSENIDLAKSKSYSTSSKDSSPLVKSKGGSI